MTHPNDGGPAFPTNMGSVMNPDGDRSDGGAFGGMSLRTYVSTQAIKGILSNRGYQLDLIEDAKRQGATSMTHADVYAVDAIAIADALLKNLEKA